MRRSLTFLVLKGINTGLATVWGFLLAHVLIRTIGLEAYAVFAWLMALAALVLQSDLGISGLVFARMRQHHLEDGSSAPVRTEDVNFLVATQAAYAAVVVLATLLLAGLLWTGVVRAAPHSLAYLLIFVGSLLALLWMPLRLAVNAHGGYIGTELVDFIRRLLLLLLTGGLLIGLPLTLYGAAGILAWALSLALVLRLAVRHGIALGTASIRCGLTIFRTEMARVGAAARFSLAEFVIYTFPYAVASMLGGASAVIAFDMFYKVNRFAAAAYLIGTETVLPHQTRAAHAGDTAALGRYTAIGVLIGCLPMTVGVLTIELAGDQIFETILHQPGLVSPAMRHAMSLMLVFQLIQATCGIVLISMGWIEDLARRAVVILMGMIAVAVAGIALGLSMDRFMQTYLLIYGLGAFAYFGLLLRLIQRIGR